MQFRPMTIVDTKLEVVTAGDIGFSAEIVFADEAGNKTKFVIADGNREDIRFATQQIVGAVIAVGVDTWEALRGASVLVYMEHGNIYNFGRKIEDRMFCFRD
jgi:hypothetical protein